MNDNCSQITLILIPFATVMSEPFYRLVSINLARGLAENKDIAYIQDMPTISMFYGILIRMYLGKKRAQPSAYSRILPGSKSGLRHKNRRQN
jgi:hypothetical protein